MKLWRRRRYTHLQKSVDPPSSLHYVIFGRSLRLWLDLRLYLSNSLRLQFFIVFCARYVTKRACALGDLTRSTFVRTSIKNTQYLINLIKSQKKLRFHFSQKIKFYTDSTTGLRFDNRPQRLPQPQLGVY